MEYMYLLVLVFVVSVNGCTDFGPGIRRKDGLERDEKKVFYSHRVVFATVTEIKDDPIFGGSKSKAAVVDIVCIYKGGVLPKRITIVGTGNKKQKIRGCPKAELKTDHSYVFFLNNKTGDHYEVEFEPLAGESEIIIDDLTIICGLKREYPKGSSIIEPITRCWYPSYRYMQAALTRTSVLNCAVSLEPLLLAYKYKTKEEDEYSGVDGTALEDICYEPVEDGLCEPYVPDPITTSTEPPKVVTQKPSPKPSAKPTPKKINPQDDEGYKTKTEQPIDTGDGNTDNTKNPGKVSGSKTKDNKDSGSSRIVISWTLALISLSLALL